MHRLFPVALAAAMAMPMAEVRAADRADLKVIRFPGSVQLRLTGMGRDPNVRQVKTENGWLIEVNTTKKLRPLGSPKFFTMPDAGMDSISFEGAQNLWRLEVTSLPGKTLAPPVITSNGRDVEVSFKAQPLPTMEAGSFDLNTPGRVSRNTYVPPLRKRATAPPVGDMAIGTIAIKGNEVRMPGAGKVERLSLRNAPARDVLMTLGRAGGYNVAFYSKKEEKGSEGSGGNPISIDFQDEPIESAVNLVLTLGGLQARRQGKTLIVGEKLPSFARQLMSRTVRLNQVAPVRAVRFLMGQGATLYRTKILDEKEATLNEVEVIGNSNSGADSQQSTVTTGPTREITGETVSIETVEADQASGALPLKGLTVNPDDRLNSLTLTGEPNLVSIAEGYLKQIDLRKRQVAVRVQVLDVDLNNTKEIDNSFALRTGNSFIVNRNGRLFANFGSLKPPSTDISGLPSNYDGRNGSPLVGSGAFQLPGGGQVFRDQPVRQYPYEGAGTGYPYQQSGSSGNIYVRPGYGPYSSPGQPGVTNVTTANGVNTYTFETPKNFEYPENQFFDFLEAQIVSRSTKVVADPTLMVQEGENSTVGVAVDTVVNINTVSTSTGVVSCSLEKEDAGLEINVKVERIDDNGFVSLSVNPKLTARANVAGSFDCGGGRGNVTFYDLARRELNTGKFRVRDGQALVLTGVIQDDVKELAKKWPLLGDMPLIGQFFRSSTSTREKRELVVVVTPRVVNDNEGGDYGYAYQPSTEEAKKLIYQP